MSTGDGVRIYLILIQHPHPLPFFKMSETALLQVLQNKCSLVTKGLGIFTSLHWYITFIYLFTYLFILSSVVLIIITLTFSYIMSGNNNSIQSLCPINTPLVNHSIKFSTFLSYEDYSISEGGSLPCRSGVEYLHRDTASRRWRQNGKSRVWDSKIWSRVPRDSDPRNTVLARASSIYKRQTCPLVREGAPQKQDRKCQTGKKYLVMSPRWGLHTKTYWLTGHQLQCDFDFD
jgi:hypothetical protein